MGDTYPPSAYESGLDHHLPTEVRRIRALNRCLFREMVKADIMDHPLTGRRRRSMVRFARKLNIDSFEARLIVRGVEYECGHVRPAAMDDVQSPIHTAYLAVKDQARREMDIAVILVTLLAYLCGVIWLLRL